ncbi:MAG: TIGR01777 family oxidoreductase [Flavisolibacter sp.]
MSTVLITGGTGMIGTALTKALVAKNYQVIILTRNVKKSKSQDKNISYAEWDPQQQIIDKDAIQKADCVIHLAGANVSGGRWTKRRKKEIIDSRVQSGQLIVKALKEFPHHVKTVISSSAIGYYGPDSTSTSKPFIETDSPVNDFLSTVVQKWEQAIQPAQNHVKRMVILRTGIVLSREGGAYNEFVKPLKFRVASILGNGKQIVSWIHIDDLVRLYIEVLGNEKWNGIYNAVTPKPVSNKEMIQAIAKNSGKSYITMTVPEFVLKIVVGEMSVEVLKSTTVSSSKLTEAGFHFLYPDINSAAKELKK